MANLQFHAGDWITAHANEDAKLKARLEEAELTVRILAKKLGGRVKLTEDEVLNAPRYVKTFRQQDPSGFVIEVYDADPDDDPWDELGKR